MVVPDPLRYLDVAVSDVPAAIRFYREAFEAIPGPAGSDELRMNDDGDALVLHVVDEATHTPSEADRFDYRKGKTPRLEIMVDDVDEWLSRAVRAGATVRCRLPADRSRPADDPGASDYAQFLDPFDHMWALGLPDPDIEPE